MVFLATTFRRLHDQLYTERDFFGPFELFLALPGLQLSDPATCGRWTRSAFILSRIVLLLQYLVSADRCYLALTDPTTTKGKALHYNNTLGVLTMILARVLAFRWYAKDVDQLKEYLRLRRSRTPASSSSYRKIVNIALTFQLVGLADRVLYCVLPSFRNELYEIPTNVATLGWPAILLTYLVTFDFSLRWAAAYNVSVTGMNTIMLGLADELSSIAQDFRHLLGKSVAADNDDFWSGLESNVRRSVQRHEQFLHQLTLLKPFLRTTFLLMFYSAALFLALGTFMISANGTDTYDLILSGFLAVLLLECYWCCRLVDKLNEVNELIGVLLYGLEWPERLRLWRTPLEASRYRQARTCLLIVMSKTRTSLGITCGGMFEMSSVAFAQLVKLAYTMLMFLRDTQH